MSEMCWKRAARGEWRLRRGESVIAHVLAAPPLALHHGSRRFAWIVSAADGEVDSAPHGFSDTLDEALAAVDAALGIASPA